MTAKDKLNFLAEMAETLGQELLLPVAEDCNLRQAAETLRAALPRQTFEINFELRFTPQGRSTIRWKIWDGGVFWEGPTLDVAVNALLRSIQIMNRDCLSEAQDVVDQLAPTEF